MYFPPKKEKKIEHGNEIFMTDLVELVKRWKPLFSEECSGPFDPIGTHVTGLSHTNSQPPLICYLYGLSFSLKMTDASVRIIICTDESQQPLTRQSC